MKVKNCIQNQFNKLNINVHKFNLLNIGLIIIASIIASIALLTNNYQSIIASKIIGLAIIPFISLCIMLIAGTVGEIWSSTKSCITFILVCLSVSGMIGFINAYMKWKPEPTNEMLIRAHFKYENIWLELFISFVAGIGIYFAILKTSTVALVGLILVISIVPAMCNAGLFWGMHIHNTLLNNKKNENTEQSLYIEYGKRSFVIFLSNITGMFLGFMVSFIAYCVI